MQAALRVFSSGELRGLDDGRDRARGGRERAGALPALPVQARPLARHASTPPGTSFAPRSIASRTSSSRRTAAVRRSRPARPERLHSPVTRAVKPAMMPNLWIQGITEAGEDREIRKHVRRHMRDVHDFVASAIRRGQEAGAIPADRDPDAEALGVHRRRAAPLRRRPARRRARTRRPRRDPRERMRWLLGEPSRRHGEPQRSPEREHPDAIATPRFARPPGHERGHDRRGEPDLPLAESPSSDGVTSAAKTAIGTKWRNAPRSRAARRGSASPGVARAERDREHPCDGEPERHATSRAASSSRTSSSGRPLRERGAEQAADHAGDQDRQRRRGGRARARTPAHPRRPQQRARPACGRAARAARGTRAGRRGRCPSAAGSVIAVPAIAPAEASRRSTRRTGSARRRAGTRTCAPARGDDAERLVGEEVRGNGTPPAASGSAGRARARRAHAER